MGNIAQHIEQVHRRISEAARACGRDPATIQLLAVSKTRPVEDILQAAQAGLSRFGESYVREALDKISALRARGFEWHFIGAIQSNKTRDIAANFHWVHGIERLKIARRLSEQRPASLPPLNVCLQVNLSGEAAKSGAPPNEVGRLAHEMAGLPRLRLRGLMTLPAKTGDFASQREPFRALRELADTLRAQGLPLDTLSMGMSGDLEAAIAEGATLVRVGTDIFGPRA